MLDKWLKFVKGHERLVLVGLVALAGLEAWHKWIAHKDQSDHDQAIVAHERVQTDSQAALAAQQQVTQLQQSVARLQAQNVQLAEEVTSAISQRTSATNERKSVESTAPLGDVASRWSQIVKAPVGAITPDAGGVHASDPAARLTVQALEDGQTAESDYQDVRRLNSAQAGQIAGLNQLIASMKASAEKEQVVLAGQTAECKADLKSAKDEAGKRSRRSFWHGVAAGAGVVAGVVIRFL